MPTPYTQTASKADFLFSAESNLNMIFAKGDDLDAILDLESEITLYVWVNDRWESVRKVLGYCSTIYTDSGHSVIISDNISLAVRIITLMEINHDQIHTNERKRTRKLY